MVGYRGSDRSSTAFNVVSGLGALFVLVLIGSAVSALLSYLLGSAGHLSLGHLFGRAAWLGYHLSLFLLLLPVRILLQFLGKVAPAFVQESRRIAGAIAVLLTPSDFLWNLAVWDGSQDSLNADFQEAFVVRGAVFVVFSFIEIAPGRKKECPLIFQVSLYLSYLVLIAQAVSPSVRTTMASPLGETTSFFLVGCVFLAAVGVMWIGRLSSFDDNSDEELGEYVVYSNGSVYRKYQFLCFVAGFTPLAMTTAWPNFI